MPAAMNNAQNSLAQKLVDLFSLQPQVEAIALGGSQRGSAADAKSDIDLYVYTRNDIPIDVRKAIVELAGATRAELGMTFWGPGDEWYDAATGIEVDVIYFDASWMEGQINRVLRDHQASLGYTTCFCHTVRQSQIFFDPHGWFTALQNQCNQEYPEPLRRNIIAFNHPVLRNVIPSYTNQIVKAVERHDIVSINHRLAGLFASYFDIIFAINRIFHQGEKRLVEITSSSCSKLPVEMASDIGAVLKTSMTGDQNFLEQISRLIDRIDQLLMQEGFDV